MKGELTTQQIFYIIAGLALLILLMFLVIWMKRYGLNIVDVLPTLLPGIIKKKNKKGHSNLLFIIFLILAVILILMYMYIYSQFL